MSRPLLRFRFGLGLCTALFGLTVLVSPQTAASDTEDRMREAGDVLQIALPVAAGVSTMVLGDWEGTKQFVFSFGTAWSVTYAFKITYGKLRPDSGARNSWPSGHTMGAFSGASFIYTRYGRVFGIPSYLLAGFTGYSRVRADKHFMDDVVAGASISMLSNWYHVTPGPKRLSFAYFPVEEGHGISMRLRFGSGTASGAARMAQEHRSSPDAATSSARNAAESAGATHVESPGRVRYHFAFGPAFLGSNRLLGTKEGDEEIRLEDFEKIDDPTTTAAAGLTVQVHPRHLVGVSLWPFESRDFARLDDPLPTAADTLPAGTRLRSIYRMIDARLQYRYTVLGKAPWDVRLGADLNLRNTHIRFEDPNSSNFEEESDLVALPLVALEASYGLTPSIRMGATAAGMDLSSDQVLDATAYFGYRFNRRWEAAAGYQFYKQVIDTDELRNEAQYHTLYMAVTHAF